MKCFKCQADVVYNDFLHLEGILVFEYDRGKDSFKFVS